MSDKALQELAETRREDFKNSTDSFWAAQEKILSDFEDSLERLNGDLRNIQVEARVRRKGE